MARIPEGSESGEAAAYSGVGVSGMVDLSRFDPDAEAGGLLGTWGRMW
jgi:hypothetical protein